MPCAPGCDADDNLQKNLLDKFRTRQTDLSFGSSHGKLLRAVRPP